MTTAERFIKRLVTNINEQFGLGVKAEVREIQGRMGMGGGGILLTIGGRTVEFDEGGNAVNVVNKEVKAETTPEKKEQA